MLDLEVKEPNLEVKEPNDGLEKYKLPSI